MLLELIAAGYNRTARADDDVAALPEAIEGSRQNTAEKHREVEADVGFASMENYEKLELDAQEALIPDIRMEAEKNGTTARGAYDRSKFSFRAKSDSYRCPSGWVLRNTGSVEVHGRIYDRYENPSACARCADRSKCTKGMHRRVFRDQNEEVRERMREKLGKKKAHQRYNKRAHTAELPFGNLKSNLKFRAVMRRGLAKVRMEAALLFMLSRGNHRQTVLPPLSIAHPPAITTPPLARVRIGFFDSLNMMLHGSRVGTWISALKLCHSVLGSSILVRLDRLRPIGYTFGMKTAISLPERVFREAERFARRARKTRSKLYAEALAEYLARHAPDGITEAMNQVSDRLGASENTFQTKAARRILSKESW